MSIHIKTRLADGIYRSSGGGETRTHYKWATGPRNLLKAAAAFEQHCRRMADCYGNIGCGRSWVEIDGQWINPGDLAAILTHDSEIFGRNSFCVAMQSPTDKARDMIRWVESGEYAAGLKRAAAAMVSEE
jgi:hypothetical protein